jgi:hypothetical protein
MSLLANKSPLARRSTMKTTSLKLIAMASIATVALSAATASANNNKKKHNSQQNNQSAQYQQGGLAGLFDLISKLKHDDDDSKPDDRVPIDPGKGNGQTNNPPSRPGFVWVIDHWERERAPQSGSGNQTPQGMPGFVWVGDHWEREKAKTNSTGTTVIVDPYPGVFGTGPVVRDHTTGGTWVGTPGAIIRDHRNDATNGGSSSGGVTVTSSNIIIRDHRKDANNTSNAPGGVTVTTSDRPRGSAGGGGGLLGSLGNAVSNVGHAVSSVGNTVVHTVTSAGNVVGIGYGSITPAGGSSNPPAAKITIIRDHRN